MYEARKQKIHLRADCEGYVKNIRFYNACNLTSISVACNRCPQSIDICLIIIKEKIKFQIPRAASKFWEMTNYEKC